MTPESAATAAPAETAASPGPASSIEPDEASLALYVHMPWCVRKCPYCDFNSHQLKSAAPDAAYIDALIRDFDLELPRLTGRRIDTVFFGGGTPSLFQPEDFGRLLGALRQRIAFADDAEITLEANPGTIERGRFGGYRDAGHQSSIVGRADLCAAGARSAGEDSLGGRHAPCGCRIARGAARQFQSRLDVCPAAARRRSKPLADVRTACALEPAHISYYQLTLEPGTVFHSRPPQLPDEDAAWQIQTEGQRLLADAGYVQYEVSAYCPPWEALPAQPQLLVVRRLHRDRRGRARQAQSRASASHPAHRQAQTAARVSAADAERPRRWREHRREFLGCARGPAVRVHAECAAAQRGLYGARLSAANRAGNGLRWRASSPQPSRAGSSSAGRTPGGLPSSAGAS